MIPQYWLKSFYNVKGARNFKVYVENSKYPPHALMIVPPSFTLKVKLHRGYDPEVLQMFKILSL